MNRYVLIFTAAYVLWVFALAILTVVFELESGSSFTIAGLLASTFAASAAFVKDYKRPPTEEEKKAFASRATGWHALTSIVISILLIGIALGPAQRESLFSLLNMPTILWFATFILTVVYLIFCYFGIRWIFGWYANLACKQRR